jgi:flavin-dependent dehydrogenase
VIPKTATVIVIGAGPAGVGTAALLEKCGLDVVVLERGEVGQSFLTW